MGEAKRMTAMKNAPSRNAFRILVATIGAPSAVDFVN